MTAWACLFVYQPVYAAKAPLSKKELQKEADLIVVGEIEKIDIKTERSQIETGWGNYDWAIYLTITVDRVEKGKLSRKRIRARCFRIKSRRSLGEFLSPSGHRSIPGVRTKVRAYLRGAPSEWDVVLPNGLAGVDPGSRLRDAPQIEKLTRGFTYIVPIEIWSILAVVIIGGLLLRWYFKSRSRKRQASESTTDQNQE